MADEPGADPAHEPYDYRGEKRRHEPGRVKTREYSGYEPHHGGVQYQEEQTEGENGDRKREDEGDRTYDRIDHDEQNRGEDQRANIVDVHGSNPQARQP